MGEIISDLAHGQLMFVITNSGVRFCVYKQTLFYSDIVRLILTELIQYICCEGKPHLQRECCGKTGVFVIQKLLELLQVLPKKYLLGGAMFY